MQATLMQATASRALLKVCARLPVTAKLRRAPLVRACCFFYSLSGSLPTTRVLLRRTFLNALRSAARSLAYAILKGFFFFFRRTIDS